jgi:hypothetical protein
MLFFIPALLAAQQNAQLQDGTSNSGIRTEYLK